MENQQAIKQAQDAQIYNLLQVMDTMQDALQLKNQYSAKQSEWNEDLYNKIQVGYFHNEADGSHQQELTSELFTCSFEDAEISLLARIKNMIESVLPNTSIVTI